VTLVAALSTTGCSDDPTMVTDDDGNTPSTRSVWQGTYNATPAGDTGVMTLDLTRTNDILEGEIVFRSRVSEYPFTYATVTGIVNGTDIRLELMADPDPWQFNFAASEDMGELTGTFSASPWNLTADIVLQEVALDTLAFDSSVPQGASNGLTVHNDELWLAHTTSFEHRTLKNEHLGNVQVYLSPGLLWTSKPLASDGKDLYGHLPISVQSGGMTSNESDIIRFTTDGIVVDRFRLAHRCAGLTWDGSYLWAVPITSEALYRFDDSGTVLETLPIDIPDAQDIVFDGQGFWAPSWYLSLLYQLDRQGNIVAVYDLPQPSGLSRSLALTWDGEHFWYLVSNLSGSTWLETFHLASP
jgi:hypothetical protein